MSDNRTKITVHAAGDPGSWIRTVQENPQIALTALALLEAYYHGRDPARTRQETEAYLLTHKRIEKPGSLQDAIKSFNAVNFPLTPPKTP